MTVESTIKRLFVTWKGRFEASQSPVDYLINKVILALIVAIVLVELTLYLVVRVVISLLENGYTIIFNRSARKLEQAMLEAKSFSEWRELAMDKDKKLELHRWKRSTSSTMYDFETVQRIGRRLNELSMRLRNAQVLEEKSEEGLEMQREYAQQMVKQLKEILNRNIGGLGLKNPALYSETHYGTKESVHGFLDIVKGCIKLVNDLPDEILPLNKKLRFFERSRHSYGRTALCLSGGATMAYYHFGVIKALKSQKLLPRIISGASGGALVAAYVCCRREDQIEDDINPRVANLLTACSESWKTILKRRIRKGVLFNKRTWMKKTRQCITGGEDYTFEEIFARFGRVLNITVTSKLKLGGPVVLNYLTAPRVVVWSAVVASAALPGLLHPVELYEKRDDGSLAVFEGFGKCWTDGAISNDIPSKELGQYFNVTYFIVSQVNPYVVPFMSHEARGSVGAPLGHGRRKGFRGGFFSSAIELLLQLEIKKWIRFIHVMELTRGYNPEQSQDSVGSIFLQNTQGDVTIFPRRGWSLIFDIMRILSDPNEDTMRAYIERGMQYTFPKMCMIAHHYRIAQMLRKYEGASRMKASALRQKNFVLSSKRRKSELIFPHRKHKASQGMKQLKIDSSPRSSVRFEQ